jgi:hypothetical protein
MKNNFIYKYFDNLPKEQIQQEIVAYHRTKKFPMHFYPTDIPELLLNLPTINMWFKDQGLTVQTCAHLVQRAHSKQIKHVDTGNQTIALNFPIEVIPDAYTVFYKLKGTIVEKFTPVTNVKYSEYVDHDPEELGRYVLRQPTFINIKLPHAIINNSDLDRYCFSFRFKEDPWHLI